MSPCTSKALQTLTAATLALGAAQAKAQTLPPPQNVVTLTANASVEVDKDWMTVVFNTTKEAGDAGIVQSQLKQALDAALGEARKAVRPGQVEVHTGAFSLAPRYSNKGVISGWQGSAELIVQGRDMMAISQLTGRIQGLTIARVGYALSREARNTVEADITAEAIGRFRARAEAVSRQFGFAGYMVREVSVSSDQAGSPAPAMLMRARASSASIDEALPVEAGKALVTATVSGSVQMK